MNYAIVKPNALFGDNASESILFNNAAYVLRRTPLFLLPYDGKAKIQPIHVKDMATLMVALGNESINTTGEELDAVGSQAPSGLELFRSLRDSCGGTAKFCSVIPSYLSPKVITHMTRPLNWVTGDVLLDSNDLDVMYDGLTMPDDPEDQMYQDRTGVLDWFRTNGSELGQTYINSVKRYYRK